MISEFDKMPFMFLMLEINVISLKFKMVCELIFENVSPDFITCITGHGYKMFYVLLPLTFDL